MEPNIKKLLEELSELLRDVISESPEAVERVDAIQDEGYSLHLLLDCQPSSESEEDLGDEGPPRDDSEREQDAKVDEREAEEREAEDTAAALARDEGEPDALPAADSRPAVFRINAADLRFLRSVGIDPTRRANKRRYRPSSEHR